MKIDVAMDDEHKKAKKDKKKQKKDKKKKKKDEKKAERKKRKREDTDDDDNDEEVKDEQRNNEDSFTVNDVDVSTDKKEKKEKKKKDKKKRKKKENHEKEEETKKKKRQKVDDANNHKQQSIMTPSSSLSSSSNSSSKNPSLPFDVTHILAPMVGASDLPYRLLTRKYGATLAYTPMISSTQFIRDPTYRLRELQLCAEDTPLVVHFSANDADEFAKAALICQEQYSSIVNAVDLNLGCPQRTAYVGHFGSYLLDPKDRQLILSIVSKAKQTVSIPIFVKIRLLDTIEETITLCEQLRDAGATLITIHARYRASFERKGPGARDGPALLDQVQEIRKRVKNVYIIANGNVISYDDVAKNMEFTGADGIMSAEGILDDPALFLPRYCYQNNGDNDHEGKKKKQYCRVGMELDEEERKRIITIPNPSPLKEMIVDTSLGLTDTTQTSNASQKDTNCNNNVTKKRKRKLLKTLREIEQIEQKLQQGGKGLEELQQEQRDKLKKKQSVEQELLDLSSEEEKENKEEEKDKGSNSNYDNTKQQLSTQTITLGKLYDTAPNKLSLANEYLQLVRQYPVVKLRTAIFHTRRMCRDLLNKYQLMEDCIACTSLEEIQNKILNKIQIYENDASQFQYDKQKARTEKDALERKRREESKRKRYEERMIRKAKREKRLDDIEYYLRQGAEVPTVEFVQSMKSLTKEEQMKRWTDGNHSQHCLAFHLHSGGCKRDRSCAFLHVEARNANAFVEVDEVAG